MKTTRFGTLALLALALAGCPHAAITFVDAGDIDAVVPGDSPAVDALDARADSPATDALDARTDSGLRDALAEAGDARDAADAMDCDRDRDGFTDVACGGDDCDDQNAMTHPGAAEVCNSRDDDCNGITDDAMGSTVCGTGECMRMVGPCAGMGTCVPGTPNPEVCNGKDDDCNGMTDDGFQSVMCGTGACAKTVPGCLNGLPGFCTPGAPSAEVCNGVDDDCNGMTDEGMPDATCGVGECMVTKPTCVGGVPQSCIPGTPSTEVCDGKDNDCDGTTDKTSTGASLCDPAVHIEARGNHTCVVRASGTVWCWGSNMFGELGCGMMCNRPGVPSRVVGLTGVVDVGVGADFSCAVSTGGATVCWGNNAIGQLGNGMSGNQSLFPVPVTGTNGMIVGVAGGTAHACAWNIQHQGFCWGSNMRGELGNGGTTPSSRAVSISQGRAFVAIAPGLQATCGFDTGGTVYCWGAGDTTGSPLLLGDTSSPSMPVFNANGATAISMGDQFACAVSNGSIRCWGANAMRGELGDGLSGGSSQPTDVQGPPAMVLSSGETHSCERDSAGVVYCWGANDSGQIGDGTTNDAFVPHPVPGIADAVETAEGLSHTCVLRQSGQVFCWGNNALGQLGDGTTMPSLVPVRVLNIP